MYSTVGAQLAWGTEGEGYIIAFGSLNGPVRPMWSRRCPGSSVTAGHDCKMVSSSFVSKATGKQDALFRISETIDCLGKRILKGS